MSKSRSPLAIIFVTIFIDLIGFGIVIPVLPLYAANFGASEITIGLLLGVFSAMQFIFAPILGRLSDKVGRRPVLFVSLIGTSIGFIIMGLADVIWQGHALWLLFAGRIIDGITGGNISTAQAYIADVTPPEQRSRRMGLIGAAFGLGFIVGPALGGLLSHFSLSAPFFFAAALAACNAVALYFLLPESLSAEHRTRAGKRVSIMRVFEESGSWQLAAIMSTYFFATIAFAMLTATFSLFTNRNERFGYDATHNGYIFAYLGLLGALIQGGLLGRLLRLFGDKWLTVVGVGVLAASLFALPLSDSLLMLLIAGTGIAIGNSFATPTLNGLASRSVGAAWQGRIFGVLQSVASLARIIGPVLGGWLLERDYRNPAGLYGTTPYWTAGLLMMIAFGLALSLRSSEATERNEVFLERSAGEEVEG